MPEQRPTFQHAVYPEGLGYSDGSFGTAKTSRAVSYLQEFSGANERMASPTGLEPV
jgi:hypothetical protein